MKKILFLGRFAPPMHGAAKMNDLYFNALKRNNNFEVKKIKLNKYDSLEDIGKIGWEKIKGYFQTLKELISEIRKFDPEVIYLEMAPRGIAFFKDSILVLISKLFKKKVFIQFHAKGANQTTKNKIAESYYKFIFKNTKIILLSKVLFDDIKNVAKLEQIEILPNGITDEITDKEFQKIIITRKKNKKLIFLFLSNMIETKGPIEVLKICNELNKEGIDFECNFIGKFQNEEFKIKFMDRVKEYRLDKKCKYLGAKYGKDKKPILQKTDFLIFPTQYPEECYPLVILEAFMYGIPVFSYNNGAISNIVNENILGFVSKNNDWRELSKKIKTQKSYPTKIRTIFKKHYELEKSVKKLYGILK